MILTLTRRWLTPTASIGELLVDGAFECFTLEDKTRPPEEAKVFAQTAIPLGRYQVVINHSPKFSRDMPLLLGVPGFEGVRIHSGNHADDTEGCILVGQARQLDEILESRAAFAFLFPKLQAAIARGETIFIAVGLGAAV